MDDSSHDFQYLLGQRVNVALQHLCYMGKFDPADIEQYAASICLRLIALSREQIVKLLPQLGDGSSRMCVSLCADFYGDLPSVLKMLGMSEIFSSVYNRGDAQSGDRVIPYELGRILSAQKVEKRGTLVVADLSAKRLDSVVGPEYRKCSLKDNATDQIAECLYRVCEIIALFGNK